MSQRAKMWAVLLLVGAGVGAFLGYRTDVFGSNKADLRLFCGGTMRRPMEVLIERFEADHHVRIETIYNGCGVLVGQMKAGETGDVYYACDAFFMNQAREADAIDESLPVATVTHFRPVIMVKKGNPKQILALDDLARPGVQLGLGLEEHGAVGHTAWALIRRSARFPEIEKNVITQAPTADYLATQLVAGPLDAVIIWDAVAANYADKAETVKITDELTDQPIALMKGARRPDLARQFIQFVRSEDSRKVFAEYGFVVDAPSTQP